MYRVTHQSVYTIAVAAGVELVAVAVAVVAAIVSVVVAAVSGSV